VGDGCGPPCTACLLLLLPAAAKLRCFPPQLPCSVPPKPCAMLCCACCPSHLQDTTEATCLEFLPHHFLLCSVGATGMLRYQDTSTGQVVASHRTRQGPCSIMRQNPWNAALCLGHGNGTVTMWTPNITTPVVRMLCHHGPLRSLAADSQGRHMVTTGADGQVRRCFGLGCAALCCAGLCCTNPSQYWAAGEALHGPVVGWELGWDAVLPCCCHSTRHLPSPPITLLSPTPTLIPSHSNHAPGQSVGPAHAAPPARLPLPFPG
jgi:hypothetical protein